MGSPSGGSKTHPHSRPMKRELRLLPHQTQTPKLDPNPNPKLSPNLTPTVSSPPNLPSFAVAGDQEDAVLRESSSLSREEVLRRRSRRCWQLLRCYRRQYWALMEEVRAAHRGYYWDHGRSPVVDDAGEVEEESGGVGGGPAASEESGGRRGLGFGPRRGDREKCGFAGCNSFAMPLTKYCHPHILLDEEQTLYKACNYVIKSAHCGQITCGKPILRATIPSLCPTHFQKADKHVSLALKKAGLNTSTSGKPAPKFHVIVAEYVRQIQAKRRGTSSRIQARRRGTSIGIPKDEKKMAEVQIR